MAGASETAGHPATAEACAAAGGKWTKVGPTGIADCDLPAADAGRSCVDDSACESACVTSDATAMGEAVTGRCYPRTMTGARCLNHVRHGVATGPVCGG